ncbi:hypothetical protein ACT17_15480 [Mycolicibacterium conceptionense]|uniref:Uncharacterized protein n=1 Tax=Mycolicibacterium conceptionense TaxID=451644 RepID=A0A0J8U833_9MYCO|nr:hypothetical protein [Mycolicibacterium conceptionense]KMV17668.1 hypothetical protein ACT17_15480 [Mycolicibacterium conceptionense]
MTAAYARAFRPIAGNDAEAHSIAAVHAAGAVVAAVAVGAKRVSARVHDDASDTVNYLGVADPSAAAFIAWAGAWNESRHIAAIGPTAQEVLLSQDVDDPASDFSRITALPNGWMTVAERRREWDAAMVRLQPVLQDAVLPLLQFHRIDGPAERWLLPEVLAAGVHLPG